MWLIFELAELSRKVKNSAKIRLITNSFLLKFGCYKQLF